MEEDDNDNFRVSNPSGDNYMEQYLNDTLGASEAKGNNSGIDAYLDEKLPIPGPKQHEKTVSERFADLKKRRW